MKRMKESEDEHCRLQKMYVEEKLKAEIRQESLEERAPITALRKLEAKYGNNGGLCACHPALGTVQTV